MKIEKARWLEKINGKMHERMSSDTHNVIVEVYLEGYADGYNNAVEELAAKANETSDRNVLKEEIVEEWFGGTKK
jgi:hypothetical protein